MGEQRCPTGLPGNYLAGGGTAMAPGLIKTSSILHPPPPLGSKSRDKRTHTPLPNPHIFPIWNQKHWKWEVLTFALLGSPFSAPLAEW